MISKHVSIIALFLILSLSATLVLMPIEIAFADVQNADFTLQTSNNKTVFMSSTGYFVTVSTNSGVTSSKLSYVPAYVQTATPTVTTITIHPQSGNCSAPDNPCSATNGSANCYSGGCANESTNPIGGIKAVWCGLTDCFVLWQSGTSGYSSQLIRVTLVGANTGITGYMNITSSFTLASTMWGFDTNTGGIGGITVYFGYSSGGNKLVRAGGTSLMGITNTISTSMDAISSISGCFQCGGNLTAKHVFVAGTTNVLGNRNYGIWNIDGDNLACSVTATTLGSGTARMAVNSYVDYSGNTDNSFILAGDSRIWKVSQNCARTNSVDYSQFGGLSYVKGLQADDTEHIYYVYHGSGQTTASITKMNLTSFQTTVAFDSINGATISGYTSGQLERSLALDRDANSLIMVGNTTRARILYLNNFNGTSPTGAVSQGEVCFVVQGTGQQICYPTDSDGNPIVGSAVETVTNQNPPTLAVGKFMCQLGVIEDCTDGAPTESDASVNGVGYILFIALLAIIMAIIGSALYGKIKIEYNLIIQMVILLTSSGLALALHWIPSLVFYGIIFIIIGFASLAGTKFFLGQTRRGN